MGVRARLTVTLVALVVLTAAVLGIGAYAFVDGSLHERLLNDARAEAVFDLSVLAPGRLGADRSPAAIQQLVQTILIRGPETIVDIGAAEPIVSSQFELGPNPLPKLGEVRSVVAAGDLGYQWVRIGDKPRLVVGGRMPPSGPDFYFVHDASGIDAALSQLRLALGGGALLLALLALVAARVAARGVLRPVEAAGRAAQRIEQGDLSARVPVASRDEFGTWALRFNRMADSLDETIGRLRESQGQNRRFVSDVSHELRTPLAALVAEASILRDHLGALPSEARRAGELLVGDVARLRTLVEELMELSRFDADAEQVEVDQVDLGRLVRTIATARLPEAHVALPAEPVVVGTEPRRLERILGNLLDNAREHGGGESVEVELLVGSDEVTIAVADRGPGVPADRLGRIFERFYKADPSRRSGSSGLGLAIAAEHAELLGGHLLAANRPEGGLRIELRLPVTRSLPAGDVPAKPPIQSRTPTSSAQEPIR
ncbi:MAG TPA: HAMP domain-containing sensor histidine kinase [Candidatus Limnocylindrales bacterium]|nr:HAMP domain-containing sensor histidine kinase [Candidatus Limnocylindrales bacterium]